MKALIVIFHIIDREFEEEYDYEAIFLKESELLGFMRENLEAGNRIEVISYKEEDADLEELKNRFFNHF